MTDVTAAMKRLGEALADAKHTYDNSPDGRKAALMALAGVCEFIETVDVFRERHLVNPLVVLGTALADLDKGAVAPMLQPRFLGHRTPETSGRRYVKTYAAATMQILMDIGFPLRESAECVAGLLRYHGFSLPGRQRQREVRWFTVAGWREELKRAPVEDQAAVAYREMIGADGAHGEHTAAMVFGIESGKWTAVEMRDKLLAGLSSTIEQTGEG
jgi:hypothetical protein